MGFLFDSEVKNLNLPAMQKTRVRSLGGEDPLEKEMATHSSILTWRIPWTEETGRLQSMESQRSQTCLSNYNRHMYRHRKEISGCLQLRIGSGGRQYLGEEMKALKIDCDDVCTTPCIY